VKVTAGGRKVVGGGMVTKAVHMKLGDPCDGESRTGVRAPIVAEKCRNGHGAKGRREVEA